LLSNHAQKREYIYHVSLYYYINSVDKITWINYTLSVVELDIGTRQTDGQSITMR